MQRMRAFLALLYWMALSVLATPVLAYAPGANTGSAPSTGGGAAPSGGAAHDAGSGAGWLWIVAALVVLAIIWWAMSSRRRGTVTR